VTVARAPTAELEAVRAELERRIRSLGSVVVAFSGGVDSSLVAALSARVLGDRALAVTAVSAALASGELDGARAVAQAVGIEHETITTDELASADYRRNDRFRCFHCKSELYSQLSGLAAARGFRALLSGANGDDAGDWRPGLRAAADHGVIHPLLEARIDKPTVRALAERLAIPSADKPASPCLASRIPYGVPVERETLERIDRAERAVRALGYRVLRVRHHGALGRLALDAPELQAVLTEPRQRAALERAIRSAGYTRAEIDDRPFRSGSLNDPLASSAQQL
jgi:pyridinium-3,5-biscarboxylic acid mononucleotide sulfurtransferase